jgi:hypothetical protein
MLPCGIDLIPHPSIHKSENDHRLQETNRRALFVPSKIGKAYPHKQPKGTNPFSRRRPASFQWGPEMKPQRDCSVLDTVPLSGPMRAKVRLFLLTTHVSDCLRQLRTENHGRDLVRCPMDID